jgi:hypothetical protein
MFQEFSNQTFTPGDTEKVQVDEAHTGYSVDGSSVRIEFGVDSGGGAVDGTNEYLDITFDTVDLSQYEEVSFYLSIDETAGDADLFKLELDGNEFLFKKPKNSGFNFILVHSEAMGAVSAMRLTSLVENLTLFMDIIGCRTTGSENPDTDILAAAARNISLDYGTETLLADYALPGSRSISLESTEYIYARSALEISEGAVTEQLVLDSLDGVLSRPLENSFSPDAVVKVLCPVVIGAGGHNRRDPVCTLSVSNIETQMKEFVVNLKNGVKQKRYMGSLLLEVAIESSSEMKLLQLAREFGRQYGDSMSVIVDGEILNMDLESEKLINSGNGILPRKSFYYKVDIQPVTVSFTQV